MKMLKRVQVSSRRRVGFHIRNKNRDDARAVASAAQNRRDAAPVLRPETDVFTSIVRKLAA